MKRGEALSGAPIFRGRWAAILWLWASGFCAGDTDFGLVWAFIPDAERPLYGRHWAIDGGLAVASVVFLIAGLISLDQYGRNAWLSWAPDDVRWAGFSRSEVMRQPMFHWAVRSYDWKNKQWHP